MMKAENKKDYIATILKNWCGQRLEALTRGDPP